MGSETGGESRVPVEFPARTKSFVRRSRGIPANLHRVLEKHGPDYIVRVSREGTLTTISEATQKDWAAEFQRSAPLVVEVGSGNGEQIVAAAKRHPDMDFVAFEVWRPGVAKLISRAATANLTNIRVVEADAAQAVPLLFNPGSVREVWTFFPDPWRKKRHQKRRIVDEEFARQIERILEVGGCWRLATDWDDYAWQMRNVVEATRGFVNPHKGARPDTADPESERGGYAPRFAGRLLTKFEEKGIEAGRKIRDLAVYKQDTRATEGTRDA